MFCDLFLSEMQGKLIGFGSWGVESFQIKIYIFKVKNRISSKRCEICSKLTLKTPERLHSIFIVNFELISHFF